MCIYLGSKFLVKLANTEFVQKIDDRNSNLLITSDQTKQQLMVCIFLVWFNTEARKVGVVFVTKWFTFTQCNTQVISLITELSSTGFVKKQR